MNQYDTVKSKIKDWIRIIDKDIEENQKRDFIVKSNSDGSTEVGYYRIVYSPENVRKLLEELLK